MEQAVKKYIVVFQKEYKSNIRNIGGCMYYLQKKISDFDYKKQQSTHKEQLAKFDKLIEKKSINIIKNDIEALDRGNEIFLTQTGCL